MILVDQQKFKAIEENRAFQRVCFISSFIRLSWMYDPSNDKIFECKNFHVMSWYMDANFSIAVFKIGPSN